MKKLVLTIGCLGLLVLSSCNKEKTCRCATINQQTIRIIQLDRGKCEDIRFVYYDRNGGQIASDQDLTDSVICTDHKFLADTVDIFAK